MFTGSVVDPQGFWHSLTTGKGWPNTLTPISETLTYATPLIIDSIGVGIAFQTGIFNIGANGQAVLGGIAGAAAGSMLHMPAILHVPLTLLAGIIGGVIAGSVPGILKAYTGAHEVIVTIMFNYVMYAFLLFAVLSTPLQQRVSRTTFLGPWIHRRNSRPSSGLLQDFASVMDLRCGGSGHLRNMVPRPFLNGF